MAPQKKSQASSLKAKQKPSPEYWQLQTAKAQFSEVFRRAREQAPQVVTRQGKDAVVIVAIEEYARLTHRAAKPQTLASFFAESPLVGSGIDLERKPDYGRPVTL